MIPPEPDPPEPEPDPVVLNVKNTLNQSYAYLRVWIYYTDSTVDYNSDSIGGLATKVYESDPYKTIDHVQVSMSTTSDYNWQQFGILVGATAKNGNAANIVPSTVGTYNVEIALSTNSNRFELVS